MVRRVLALALALAAIGASVPSGAATRSYAFTRGSGFATGNSELLVPTLVLPQGTELVFVNLHIWGHSIMSDDWKTPWDRLFLSEVVPFGVSSVVEGVSELEPGTYGFFCSNHRGMRGEIVIV